MPKHNIKSGDLFNKLTIICEVKQETGRRYFKCKCLCGKVVESVILKNLINGKTKSCGCARLEANKNKMIQVKPGEVFNRLTIIEEV